MCNLISYCSLLVFYFIVKFSALIEKLSTLIDFHNMHYIGFVYLPRLNSSNMTAKEYNKDFWCVMVHPVFGRCPVSLPVLTALLGSKIYMVFRKLDNFKDEKLILRPFHGQTYIFYRH